MGEEGEIERITSMEQIVSDAVLLKVLGIYVPQSFSTTFDKDKFAKVAKILKVSSHEHRAVLNYAVNKKLNEYAQTKNWTPSKKRFFIDSLFQNKDSKMDLSWFLKKAKKFKCSSQELANCEEERRDFVERWPLEKIKILTKEEYDSTIQRDRDDFCYLLEFKKILGGIGMGGMGKFGLYHNKRSGKYTKDGESITNAEADQEMEKIRKELFQIIELGQRGKIKEISAMEKIITRNVLAKILEIYAPQYFSTRTVVIKNLKKIATILGLPLNNCPIELSYSITKKLNEIDETKSWPPDKKGLFIFDLFTQKEKEVKSQSHKSLNKIFYGPPGTGKTYNIVREAVKIIDGEGEYNTSRFKELRELGQIEFITFHQSYSYEEFIEGIRPVVRDGQVSYEVKDGAFKKFVAVARENPDKNHVFIIDEINRGNISKIFGELITLLEGDKREGQEGGLPLKLPYSEEEFIIPPNIYLLGTINTADRSIAMLDVALRRRFIFKKYMPDSDLVVKNVEDIPLRQIMNTVNKKIANKRGKDYQIGHSYFMKEKIKNEKDLKRVWYEQIMPLLNEYFYEEDANLESIIGPFAKDEDHKDKDFASLMKKLIDKDAT